MKLILYIYIICILITIMAEFCFGKVVFFPNRYPRKELSAKPSTDAGDPLLLTPYLQQGSIELAQNLSIVALTEKIGVRSHAGFFTVDDKYQSNLYFWYFPPFSKNVDAPVMLWLQGGPGVSSLFGLFIENGPIIAKKDGFATRKYHWALDNHLIFIDSPVGTGFSFTKSDEGYCKNETCISEGLYNCMQQFFTLFPDLRKNDFYISGESYAGKYIPSLAMEIHKQNSKLDNNSINLKGLAIGNGYCDPKNQINYGDYLYKLDLIDDNQVKVFEMYQKQIVLEIKREDWLEADLLMDRLMDGQVSNFSFFKSFTGFDDYYFYLESKAKDIVNVDTLFNLLQNNNVRRSIHVGGLQFHDGLKVQIFLANDMLKSVAPYIEELLSFYKIMFYNGQYDIVVGYPITVNFLHNLNFSAGDEYRNAERKFWEVDDDLAGYIKKAGNLTEVLVMDAGHMVPYNQPKRALDLITRFIKDNL